MKIFVMTHSQGKLAMYGPFTGSTSIDKVQKAQIWVSNWSSKLPSGELPQWWIVEQDVPDGATLVTVPVIDTTLAPGGSGGAPL